MHCAVTDDGPMPPVTTDPEGLARVRPAAPPLAAAQLQRALDSARDCIFLFRPDSLRFFYVNRGASEHLGYSRDELLAMTPMDVDARLGEAEIRALLEGLEDGSQESVTVQTLQRHRDGRLTPSELSLQYHAVAGESPFFVGIVRDVSHHLRIEQREHAARQRYQALFEQAGLAIAEVAPNGRPLRANRRFCELLGYPPGELLEQSLRRLTVAQDWHAEEARLAAVAAGERDAYTLDKRFLRRDGAQLWCQVSVSAIRDGAAVPQSYMVIATDITQRRQSEAAFAVMVERLADKAGLPFFDELVRALGDTLGCDYAWVAAFDQGGDDHHQQVVVVKDHDRLVHDAAVTGGDDSPCGLARDGRETWLVDGACRRFPDAPYVACWRAEGLACVPLRDKGGQVVGALGLASRQPFADMGLVDRLLRLFAVRASAELQRLRAEEARAEALAANRRLVRRVLEVQEQERRRLASDLHDELGQALTAVKTDAELIAARVRELDPEAAAIAADMVTLAQGTIRRVRSITRQLRPVTLDRLGLKDAITETVREWATRHPRIACELKTEGRLEELDWTENIALYRVLQEALTNVSRHAGADRVSVRVAGRSRAVEEAGLGRVCLVVEDDGAGPPAGGRGDGLGLTLMAERMAACGGMLELTHGELGGCKVVARLK